MDTREGVGESVDEIAAKVFAEGVGVGMHGAGSESVDAKPFDEGDVESSPEGDVVYVAVGANLGDREAAFSAVIREIEALPQLELSRASPVFETAPVGPEGQGAYLNAVLALRTKLAPLELLRSLQAIEARLGRDRRREVQRWGPREVDLDILFMGSRRIDLPDLVVPHPRAHERAFVMIPLAALAPDFVHPLLGSTVEEIAASLHDPAAIRAWPSPPGWPD